MATILSLVDEDALFKNTTPISELFFTEEDYAGLRALGEVVHFPEADLSLPMQPEARERLEHVLARTTYIYQTSRYIPEDLMRANPQIKAVANIRNQYPPYSRSYYVQALARGQVFLTGNTAYSASVAEMALGYLIDLFRGITELHNQMRAGSERFGYSDANKHLTSLFRKRIGIVGLGNIARIFVSLLKPFTVEIQAYDPFVAEDVFADLGVARCGMDVLLESSDAVVLMANPNQTTAHLIDRGALARMKQGALLINVSRSQLLDYEALADWLAQGRGKAALDVYDREPLEQESPLRSARNLIMTPHMAGGIADSYRRLGRFLVEDFRAIERGELPSRMRMLTLENLDLYHQQARYLQPTRQQAAG